MNNYSSYVNPILSAARKEIENSERVCKKLDKADRLEKKVKKLESEITKLKEQLQLAKSLKK
jgi:cell shape-determining protein MreC